MLPACNSSSGTDPDQSGSTSLGHSAQGDGQLTAVDAIVLAASGGLRLQYPWGSTTTVDLVRGDTVLASYGTKGDYTRANLISDATFAPDGSIWMVDRGNRRIIHLDESMRLISEHRSIGDVALRSPAGIESLSDGRIVVSDTRVGVAVMANVGARIHTNSWGLTATDGSDGSRAIVPREITVTNNDEILIHDRSGGTSPRILRMSGNDVTDHDPVPIRGTHTSLAVGSSGDTFGTNASNGTISRLRSDGSVETYTISGDRSMPQLARNQTNNAVPTGLPVSRITIDRSTDQCLLSMPIGAHDFHVHTKGDVEIQTLNSTTGN